MITSGSQCVCVWAGGAVGEGLRVWGGVAIQAKVLNNLTIWGCCYCGFTGTTDVFALIF